MSTSTAALEHVELLLILGLELLDDRYARLVHLVLVKQNTGE